MALIPVTRSISIDESELGESFIRASGPGGQHVNTTSTAVQLRFDVRSSPSLPEMVKRRLEEIAGNRLTRDGVIVLTAESERSQQMNRDEVRQRLLAMIREAAMVPKKRRPTRPSRAAKAARVDAKKKRSGVKALRSRVEP
jgi:ribosome-associated protein